MNIDIIFSIPIYICIPSPFHSNGKEAKFYFPFSMSMFMKVGNYTTTAMNPLLITEVNMKRVIKA